MKTPGPGPGMTYYGKKNPKDMVAEKIAARKVEGGLTKQTPKAGMGGGASSSSKSKNLMPMPRKMDKATPKRNVMPMPRKIQKMDPKKAIMPAQRY